MDIFTTDYQHHTDRDGDSGNPMAVAHSYCYKFFVKARDIADSADSANQRCRAIA